MVNPPGDSISRPDAHLRRWVSLFTVKVYPMQRVIAYIDGFNLYYGLKSQQWKRYYWLDIQKMTKQLLAPDQTLVKTKYFTTIVVSPKDKHNRQAVFLEALQTLSEFEIFYGHFIKDTITCWRCGHKYTTHHEKMTDVNIAIELTTDAFQNNFDTALLVSADGDLVAPIEAVKCLPDSKRIVAVFPPGRHSNALKKVAHAHITIWESELSKSIFPDQVTKPDGFVLQRPARWK